MVIYICEFFIAGLSFMFYLKGVCRLLPLLIVCDHIVFFVLVIKGVHGSLLCASYLEMPVMNTYGSGKTDRDYHLEYNGKW